MNKMAYKNFFFFDIETTSKSSSLFDLGLDDPRGAELFRKKWESMKKFDADWNREIEDVYIDKAPLLPEFGRIICMSFGMFTDDKKHIMTLVEEDEEALMRRILKIFTKASQSKRFLCGFNVKAFDVPWIIKKMYKYDIDLPHALNFSTLKPWEINIIDISEIWKGIGKTTSSLNEISYELGLSNQNKIMNGAEVYNFFWKKHDISSIVKHCEEDVDCFISIAEKLKL
jgi:uncharacterized protein YprB with RNaseH-like and TPR domain